MTPAAFEPSALVFVGQLVANDRTNEKARQQLTDTAENIGLASNERGSGLRDIAAAPGFSSGDDLQ
jgi:subtilisin